MPASVRRPVLILGAGINGCAVARELVLNGVPVRLVDAYDIAAGATARSSRLIHGGLRYLEYADFDLVRESLHERNRLLRLAPQFVEPLRLYIPVRKRTGGLLTAAVRFLGLSRTKLGQRLSRWLPASDRGLWSIRTGLWLYDMLAGRGELPPHRVFRIRSESAAENRPPTSVSEPIAASLHAPTVRPRVDTSKYHWLCAYSDAQMRYPERFVLAMLEDARESARQQNLEFQVYTYHRACLREGRAELLDSAGMVVEAFEPAAIVNATGAWGDATLRDLGVSAEQLFGGTKGSHFVTRHPGLRRAIGNDGVYAETPDGRLVFVLPFGESVLVGTTDEVFEDDPAAAVASQQELEYLVGLVNEVFPELNVSLADVDMHYSGVRPLPRMTAERTGAISRGHSVAVHEEHGVSVYTLIGGKLTTCRAFAEEVADCLLAEMGLDRCQSTRDHTFSGGQDYPPTAEALRQTWEQIARRLNLDVAQVQAVWTLCGNRIEQIADEQGGLGGAILVGTSIPVELARWMIKNEWVARLDDLVERRLMLIYESDLSLETLQQLADCLVEAGRLAPEEVEATIEKTRLRLLEHYGKHVLAGRVV
jgi:glycerol-3-phosphate dehydrogenase